MAVTSYGREPGYPRTSKKLEGKRIIVVHNDRYKIVTNDANQVGEYVLDGTPYQLGFLLDCGSTPTRIIDLALSRSEENRLLWFLDVTADSTIDEEDAEESQTPPDQRTPEWSWDFETIEQIIATDVNGLPVVNGVGEPFELTAPRALPVLHIERWEPTFDPDTILDYMNTVNDAEFWGAPAGSALMAGIRDRKDTQEVYAGVYYRKVSYTIKFALPFVADALEGWTELLLNRGTFYLAEDGLNTKIHFMAGGQQITGNLDILGHKLAEGLPAQILRFEKFSQADFSALNLGPY